MTDKTMKIDGAPSAVASAKKPSEALSADDLIVDRALEADDRDSLDHGPVAERVADLVATSTTPLNVALFGPWGSGKSSFAQLLDVCLKRYPRVKLVTYNAWTFEGESLQRSFISSVATALEMRESDSSEYIQFHTGLYEHRRSARLKLTGWDVTKLAGVAAIVAVFALAFLIAVVALVAHWVGDDVVQSVVAAIPSLLPTTAVTAILASTIREIIAGARVEVDASAPTQEQFREKFKQLVARARSDKHHERLVFFIDELDRCSPEQVVKVLAAVRHFFDQPDCVFVIAADRDVIEKALDEKAEHATPVNPDNPYYSSASEYLDKVFQHQLALPPLRGRRLTRFARDLVEAKTSGLWADLAEIDAGRLRDQLVYILVPSHVRSPRRVKVLLNNFATNYRIAQARGINAVANAAALAKLSALRTEFPLFAVDLMLEPRLPTLLFKRPANPSPRVSALLKRHQLPDPKALNGAGLTATDVTLADASEEETDELNLTERTLLRRYIVRTNQFPDPSRDLLYLEPAGAAVDLTDPAFGELLEAASIEDPELLIQAAREQLPDEIRKALRVLADMVNLEFGEERSNVVTSLLGLANQLEYVVAPHESEVLGALKVQLNEEGFEPEQLAPALALALKAEDQDETLTVAILRDPRLMADASQAEAVATIADGMTKEQRQPVWAKVTEFYSANPDILLEPVARLDKEVAKELLELPALGTAMRTRWNGLAAEESAEEIDALLDVAQDRSDESEGIRGVVLYRMAADKGNAYASLLRRQSDLGRFTERAGFRPMTALRAMRVGPATDWIVWASYLDPVPSPWTSQPKAAMDTAVSLLSRWPEAAGSEPAATAGLARVASLIPPGLDADFEALVTPPAQTALGATAWWGTGPAATAQGHLQGALSKLGIVGPHTGAALSQLVVSDIERAFVPQPNAFAYRAAQEQAANLETTNLRRFAEGLTAVVPQPALLEDHARARLAVAMAARDKGADVHTTPYVITAKDVVTYLDTAARADVLVGWFALSPDFTSGLTVALSLGPEAPAVERQSVVRWSASLTLDERTELTLRLSALATDTSDWIGDLSRESIDEAKIVEELGERLRSATRGEDRADLARSVSALRPGQPAAQHAVGTLVVWLFEQNKQVDSDTALILVPALGEKHRMGQKIADAVEQVAKSGFRLPNRALQELQRAKVPLKKRSLPEDVWDRIKGLRRGR